MGVAYTGVFNRAPGFKIDERVFQTISPFQFSSLCGTYLVCVLSGCCCFHQKAACCVAMNVSAACSCCWSGVNFGWRTKRMLRHGLRRAEAARTPVRGAFRLPWPRTTPRPPPPTQSPRAGPPSGVGRAPVAAVGPLYASQPENRAILKFQSITNSIVGMCTFTQV